MSTDLDKTLITHIKPIGSGPTLGTNDARSSAQEAIFDPDVHIDNFTIV
jgi:hypothetical protein